MDDNSHVLAKCYEILPSGRRFCIPKSNTMRSAVSIISEQINLFKHQSRVCVCVCVCKLHKLLVCFICNFCIFNNCSLSSKICVTTVYCG